MKVLYIIFLCLLPATLLSMQSQIVPVISSDRKLCKLPLWKVRESETLHKLFLEEEDNQNNPLRTIKISSVSAQKLDLVCTALEKPFDEFSGYFDSLTPEEQQLLIIAAGKKSAEGKQLRMAGLTAQLLQVYCDETLLTQQVSPHLNLNVLITHMQRNISDHTFNNQLLIQETVNDQNSYIKYDQKGHCSLAPLLVKDNPYYDCTINSPHITYLDKSYTVEYMQKRSGQKIEYIITPYTPDYVDEPSKNYKKNIFLAEDNFLLRAHKLKHPYPIHECQFSKDGTYMTSISQHPNLDVLTGEHMNKTCLILTKLDACGNSSDFIDITLSNNTNLIITAHFNPQSTLIAAGTTNGVYIWDMHGNNIRHCVDNDYPIVNSFAWSDDGTLLYVLEKALPSRSCSSKFIIYDLHNHAERNIVPIIYATASHLSYFPLHNTIIIPVQKMPKCAQRPDKSLLQLSANIPSDFHSDMQSMQSHSMFILFDPTINTITHCIPIHMKPPKELETAAGVISPQKNFLAIVMTSEDPTFRSAVHLYSFTLDKWITLPKLVGITGIGFSPDERSLIVTTHHINNTLFHFYSNNDKQCFKWLHSEPTILQRYTLLRHYKAMLNNTAVSLHQNNPLLAVLESLKTEQPDVVTLINNFRESL